MQAMETATKAQAIKQDDAVVPSGAPAGGPFWLRPALQFAAVAFQFALVVLVVRLFQIENAAFLKMMIVGWVGFVVHHFLPENLRTPFFAILSIAGIVIVLGPEPAAWLVGVGGAVIGLAHLPVPFRARLGLLVAMAGFLAACRVQWFTAPWPNAIWPILGSMFMFRFVIYLYDLSHHTAKFSLWWSLSYFFMLPNVCFPLFPVVDYKTFRKSKGVVPIWETYQQGIRWMIRGLLHLLAYRFVYQNLLIDATDVNSAGSAAQLIVTTFMLYLRVSGAFHMIVGLLHMFGFNLPKAFNLWLLSSSFTDFWRRINIYWKDFMLKVFFNPAMFVLKKPFGATGALAAATAYTFLVTWALHSYQDFWIRKTFPIVFQQIVFWGFLGVMILANVLLENKYGRKRAIGGAKPSLISEGIVGLQCVAMFVVIVIAWSFWSTGSVDEWLSVMAYLKSPTLGEMAFAFVALASLGVAAIVARRMEAAAQKGGRLRGKKKPAAFWRPAAINAAICISVFVVGKKPEALAFSPALADAAQRLTKDKLNERDSRKMERGYYEGLADVATFNGELAERYNGRPTNWNINPSIRHNEGAYPPYDLYPSVSVPYKGATLSTNEWGMRDKAYTKAKPSGVFRIAIFGSSHTVGVGVEDAETFENLVEARLNKEFQLPGFTGFEILNFSVSGYGPVGRSIILEDKVFAFDPDMVVYIGVDDVNWMANEMSHAVSKSFPLPYPELVVMLEDAGVTTGLKKVVAEQRLKPHREALLLWVYERMVKASRDRGILATATFLPRPEEDANDRPIVLQQPEIAARAGFDVLATADAYDGMDDVESLWVAEWDRHPNAQGHRLLADAFYDAVTKYLMELSPKPRAVSDDETQ